MVTFRYHIILIDTFDKYIVVQSYGIWWNFPNEYWRNIKNFFFVFLCNWMKSWRIFTNSVFQFYRTTVQQRLFIYLTLTRENILCWLWKCSLEMDKISVYLIASGLKWFPNHQRRSSPSKTQIVSENWVTMVQSKHVKSSTHWYKHIHI